MACRFEGGGRQCGERHGSPTKNKEAKKATRLPEKSKAVGKGKHVVEHTKEHTEEDAEKHAKEDAEERVGDCGATDCSEPSALDTCDSAELLTFSCNSEGCFGDCVVTGTSEESSSDVGCSVSTL